MDMKGQHLIIDAYHCQSGILNQAEELKELLINAIHQLGMEILSTHFHSFTPQGVTGVIGISTSHLSIHTWPEHGYAALDLYTCGEQDIWPVWKNILQALGAERVEVYELTRGEEERNNTPSMKKLLFQSDSENRNSQNVFQLDDNRGNDWDKMQLREIVTGKHEVLFHGSSQFQDILLVHASDLRLYLDQELQFCSLDERYYHEALVFPVMELAQSPKRVLILGGGDGLALREVLKYSSVKHVDLVDIDPLMLQLAKTEPFLLAQNNRSFLDDRVHAHTVDAKKYIEGKMQRYDAIIIDFPDPVNPVISELYTTELFTKVAKLLSKKGVLVCQSNSPEDSPKVFWSIAGTIKKAGLHTLEYNVTVPSFGLWGFHLATHKKITNNLPEISVPHQALSTNMESLFVIPADIVAEQEYAIVNSVDELKLHELYQEEIQEMY